MFSILSKVSQDLNFAFESPPPPIKEDIRVIFERVLSGDRRDMLRVITKTQRLAKKAKNRKKILRHLKEKCRRPMDVELDVNSFYSVKEFLGTILNVCMKEGDEFGAFEIIRYSQNLTFREERRGKIYERKMCTFYYSHPVTRRLEFWIESLKILFEVSYSLALTVL